MRFKPLVVSAIIGLTLTALLLTGSSRAAATSINRPLPPELVTINNQGRVLLSGGKYLEARGAYLRASVLARKLGLQNEAARDLVNAGSSLYLSLNFRGAQEDFGRALDLAQSSGDPAVVAAARNNLANLYSHMGQPEKALRMATEALAGPEGNVDTRTHAMLLFQRAMALSETNRFTEAEPLYTQAIAELTDRNDFDSAARIQSDLGERYLRAGRLDDAESALSLALWTVRIHRLNASANVLCSLAQLKSRQGDARSAALLFEAALDAPPNISPGWVIRSSRGKFRLENGDLPGALDDFREARRVALRMRADIVPADQDRVALEKGLSLVMEGLVDAGNRMARETGDRRVLQETFDAAEQDRMWSLRALVPSPNDWRSRLPDHYWELLAQYQALERTPEAARSPASARKIDELNLLLQRIEAASAGESMRTAAHDASALAHVQSLLNDDSVLFSFLITKTSAWVWAVDRGHVAVFPLAEPSKIEADAASFTRAVRSGNLRSGAAAETWRDLFRDIPAAYLNHRRWLIEPDGALNNIPFAALDASGEDAAREGGKPPVLAIERAAIQSIPGALLLEPGSIPSDAPFLGIGDAIYNRADARYQGKSAKADLTLPRLPGAVRELESCSKAWGSARSKLLTGSDATVANVSAALRSDSAIVHFATHVIAAPGEFRSGMIALSLDASGAMGLLGPKEIVARPVVSSLVVMNGCHSAQGQSLPSAGLMGLTRAWIGAGAKSVIATAWDLPDTAADSIMVDFYDALRSAPERGASLALQTAQKKAIQRGGAGAGQWAAYSLLSRVP